MTHDEVTRRSWILRLGGATALTGFSGTLVAAEPPLPPGLYEPSLDHLAHSLKTATAPMPDPPPPRYFAPEDFSLIQELVALMLGEEPAVPPVPEIAVWIDLIVGRSDSVRTAARSLTPAHRRLAVDFYGQDTVRELESEEPQAICRAGLAALKRGGFRNLDTTARMAQLVELENAGNPFIAWLKRRVLDGFYTSRQGLQELDYKGNAFWPESPGCGHDHS
ncbi:MAG: hypothetical protein DMG57_22215 [Acidobacteria bacterium]|nr:MAG: hypothetical protein DMG57_22215 [Acidobacteriota bacterium]